MPRSQIVEEVKLELWFCLSKAAPPLATALAVFVFSSDPSPGAGPDWRTIEPFALRVALAELRSMSEVPFWPFCEGPKVEEVGTGARVPMPAGRVRRSSESWDSTSVRSQDGAQPS